MVFLTFEHRNTQFDIEGTALSTEPPTRRSVHRVRSSRGERGVESSTLEGVRHLTDTGAHRVALQLPRAPVGGPSAMEKPV
jgi:hypothetical protein